MQVTVALIMFGYGPSIDRHGFEDTDTTYHDHGYTCAAAIHVYYDHSLTCAAAFHVALS